MHRTPQRSSRAPRARWSRLAAGAALLGGLAVAAAASEPASGHGWGARAVLRDASGAKVGTVRFDGDDDGTTVKVVVRNVSGAVDAYHGFHVHANPTGGECDPATAFMNVGGHWTTPGALHGHHEGDLPSLLVQADRTGSARSVTGRFDPDDLLGKAVILHADPDNLANIPAARYKSIATGVAGPDSTTTATGDSGGRIACGIITAD